MRNILTEDGKVSVAEYGDTTQRKSCTHVESLYKRSTHLFDSQFGQGNGAGFTFRYVHSMDKVIGYRIASILVDGIVGPFSNPIYLALHSNLSRASFSGHRNGSPESIISAIYNPGTSARIIWNYDINGFVPIEMDSTRDIYLELRDPTGIPQPQFRFVIQIEFTHAF